MREPKKDKERLQHIVEAADFVIEHSEGMILTPLTGRHGKPNLSVKTDNPQTPNTNQNLTETKQRKNITQTTKRKKQNV